MATFLQLCAALARESGAIGAAPSSVTGQTGRQEKAVNWIADAWLEIQNERRGEWLFLRKTFDQPLVIGTSRYTGAALGLGDFGSWPTTILPSIRTSSDDEAEIRWLDYERWRRAYDFGNQIAQRPVAWAVSPMRELCVGPKPDQAYQIRGEYQRAPQVLAANGDVPLCPEEYHMVIVHRAHMALCAHDEAWNAYKGAQARHDPIYRALVNGQIATPHTSGNSLT